MQLKRAPLDGPHVKAMGGLPPGNETTGRHRMINADRVLNLATDGFELAWEKWLGRQFNYNFVRSSELNGVFEHVDIDSAGKHGEAVYCHVVLSPLRGHQIQFKPTPEVDQFMFELADPESDRGYTLIESTEDAMHWEARVADIAPARVCALAKQHAEDVVQQTASARVSAQEYVRHIREFSDERVMEYLAVQMRAGRAPEKSSQSEKFSGLMTSQDDLADGLECASLAISRFGPEVDPDNDGFRGESASQNRELRLRLDITADLLRHGA